MVIGQVSSCRWLYRGGGVTEDKIRPANRKRQWTDETERKRTEEWKGAIKAGLRRLNRGLQEATVACFLMLRQMEIWGFSLHHHSV